MGRRHGIKVARIAVVLVGVAFEEDLYDEDDGDLEHTFLTFQVAQEEYGVAVAYVTEILRLQKMYALPDVPDYIRGVISLRGKIVPLLDVRQRFNLPQEPYTDRTVLVVLELGRVPTGLIVDAVLDVVEIPADQIEPVSASMRGREREAMVAGIGKRPNGVSMILDVASLLDTAPDSYVHSTAGGPTGQDSERGAS